MSTFIYVASGLAGLYLIWIALQMKATGFLSVLLFKFVPLVLGLCALVSAGKSAGFL